MSVKISKIYNLAWVNIDEPDKAALKYLRDNFNFHQLDLQDVLDETQIPKIDVYQNYIFLILHFPLLDDELKSVELYVFVGKNFLVTISRKKIKTIRDLFFKSLKNINLRKELRGKRSGYLLYKILEPLFKSYFSSALKNLGKLLTDVEQEVYGKGAGKEAISQLALARRMILDLRRIVSTEKFIIRDLVYAKKEFIIPKEFVVYFDDIGDYLDKVWTTLDDYKNIVDGLYETNETIISLRTNEVIKLLTIFSVALLPLSLLAGIYGMNIEKLPFIKEPSSVWLVFGGLTAVIVAIIIFFRRKGYI